MHFTGVLKEIMKQACMVVGLCGKNAYILELVVDKNCLLWEHLISLARGVRCQSGHQKFLQRI